MKLLLTLNCAGCTESSDCILFKHLSYLDDCAESTDLSLQAAIESIAEAFTCPYYEEEKDGSEKV